ncbi:transposase family protein [Burkholderia ubonensis]|uniref:transposase family protein n=1 Tax=Burkholderia ubonensis TaxID=101571 RepID=UPI0039F59276
MLSIEEAFGGLTDPRSRPSPHDLREVLFVSLCAILSGADSWVAIPDLGRIEARLVAPVRAAGARDSIARDVRSGIRGTRSAGVRSLLRPLDVRTLPGAGR